MESLEKPSGRTIKKGSVQALIADYKRAPEFTKLNAKTQLGYARSLDKLAVAVGDFQAAQIERHHIVRIRNAFASKPRSGDDFVAAAEAGANDAEDPVNYWPCHSPDGGALHEEGKPTPVGRKRHGQIGEERRLTNKNGTRN